VETDDPFRRTRQSRGTPFGICQSAAAWSGASVAKTSDWGAARHRRCHNLGLDETYHFEGLLSATEKLAVRNPFSLHFSPYSLLNGLEVRTSKTAE